MPLPPAEPKMAWVAGQPSPTLSVALEQTVAEFLAMARIYPVWKSTNQMALLESEI